MILCVRKYSKAPKCMNFLPTEGHLEQVMLYDGVCNLCNGWVNFVIDRDPQSRYKFAALQGEAGRALMTRVGRGRFAYKLHANDGGTEFPCLIAIAHYRSR